jgi:allantoicase
MPDPSFLDLPDLACDNVGGVALVCNDEFFAEKENLLKPHPAEWKEHAYTDRGKWMDGWETRRRRTPGHDWCVIRLGMPGLVRGVVVDTAHFRGNFPAECSIEGCELDDPLDLAALSGATWLSLLPRSPLEGHHANRFEITCPYRITHLRLNIFPDGGVARLRVHGEVVPRAEVFTSGMFDLAALAHGGWVESCSDMFFGSRNNLIRPGPSSSMADGWETRRRRGPGNDWAIVRLAATGTVERLEIDTSHFKGNAPGRCTVEGQLAGSGDLPDEGDWRQLLSTPLQPDTSHLFAAELRRVGPVQRVRLSVFPDGGVARLRVWGHAWVERSWAMNALDALTAEAATAEFLRCCGSTAWAQAMAARRPFEDREALLRQASALWWSLDEAAWLEAFAAHPRIGQRPAPAPAPSGGGGAAAGGGWAAEEQASTASAADDVLAALAAGNEAYAARHGFIYIVCASGRAADDMLADLQTRLAKDPAVEIHTAAEEQAKITRLRLARLLEEMNE